MRHLPSQPDNIQKPTGDIFMFILGLPQSYSFIAFRKQYVCVAETMQAFKVKQVSQKKEETETGCLYIL